MNSSEDNMDNGNELNSNREENQAESPRGANAQVTAEQLINWIKSRRSIGNLSIPAPTESQIRAAIDCAVTAPDHKKLRPWRFIVTQGNARHDLGRALLAAAEAQAVQEGEELSEKSRKKTYNMPLRAPVIITVVTHMQVHKKVPPFEQMLSAGAAVQNLILALQAQGFSTVWRTGLLANEPAVKAYFDVGADDYVTAFVYTGSSPCDMPTRKPIDIEPLLRFES
ncbi:nitroreductase [Psychrobacter sp. Sarcosine-02u-2]|uniref:nitroreductase family protein n=1 Tax=Psychrobacter sp. Sarcosine-02u-2 TaxID=2058324 RepID=UPI000C7B9754|nr:nitroreductase [Psychrobacter sp. Sarcosine-02u-2]PKG88782.1 nitroreductase [Psychrobacter sp. Sarcosine-02u-2]